MDPEQSAQRVLDLIDSEMEGDTEWRVRFLTVVVRGITSKFKEVLEQVQG